MRDLGEWEPEPEGEQETKFGWDEDFSRFESDDMRQVPSYTGFESKDEFADRVNKKNKAKEDILYRVFGEHFSPRFTPKMVELFNRQKLVRETDTGLVTSLTFDGKEVLRYTGERYVPTGEPQPFFKFCQEAQEEFDDSPIGKNREYLEEEEGLGDLPFDTLERLYRVQHGAREPTVLSGLERFKKLVPKGIPAVMVAVVFLATLVAATVLLVKRQSKKVTKAIDKTEKDVKESKTISPLAKTIIRVPLVITRKVTSTVSSYPLRSESCFPSWMVIAPTRVQHPRRFRRV